MTPQILYHLIGSPWEEAQEMAAAAGTPLLDPIITTPPRPKVLLGQDLAQYRVVGYRRQGAGLQLVIAAEQKSAINLRRDAR